MYGANTYWRAQIASLLGEAEDAVNLLRQAWREGWWSVWESAHRAPEFDGIRRHPAFRELIRLQG